MSPVYLGFRGLADMQKSHQYFKQCVLIATILALCVVVLGAYVRLTDAGLGCPDWPGCYGTLTVPESEAAIVAAQNAYPHSTVEVGKDVYKRQGKPHAAIGSKCAGAVSYTHLDVYNRQVQGEHRSVFFVRQANTKIANTNRPNVPAK